MRFLTRMMAKDPKTWNDTDIITLVQVIAAIAGALVLRNKHKAERRDKNFNGPWLDT